MLIETASLAMDGGLDQEGKSAFWLGILIILVAWIEISCRVTFRFPFAFRMMIGATFPGCTTVCYNAKSFDLDSQSMKTFPVRTFLALSLWLTLVSACGGSLSRVPADAWFLGEWHRSDSLGGMQTSTTIWRFEDEGTLVRDGYPAVLATADFEIESLHEGEAVLLLSNQAGPQAEWLPSRLSIVRDADRGTIEVDGGQPLIRQGSAP